MAMTRSTAHSFRFNNGSHRRHVQFNADNLVTIFLDQKKRDSFEKLIRDSDTYLSEDKEVLSFLEKMKAFYHGVSGSYKDSGVTALRDKNTTLFATLFDKYLETTWVGNVVSLVFETRRNYYTQVFNAFISSPSNCQLVISEHTDTLLETTFTNVKEIWSDSKDLKTKYKHPRDLFFEILDWYFTSVCELQSRCLIQFHITEEIYEDHFKKYINYLKKKKYSVFEVEFVNGPISTNESEQYYILLKSLEVCSGYEEDDDAF